MVKKFWSILFTLILIPYCAFAISLNELKSAPDRYVRFGSMFFMDIQTIKSLLNKPPHFALQATVYDVSPSQIIEYIYGFDYDYNRSFYELSKNKNIFFSTEEIIRNSYAKAQNNSGIYFTMKLLNIYSLDGTLIHSYNSTSSHKLEKLDFGTRGYAMADFAFQECYEIPFWRKKRTPQDNLI